MEKTSQEKNNYFPDYLNLAKQCAEKVAEAFARRLYKEEAEEGIYYTFANEDLFFSDGYNPFGQLYIADRYIDMLHIYEAEKRQYDPMKVLQWHDYDEEYGYDKETRVGLMAFVGMYKNEPLDIFSEKMRQQYKKRQEEDFEDYFNKTLKEFREENEKIFSDYNGKN